ncbi:hypothetical protein [Aquidulcibacter sp.]|jgi:hypothetical protein|uniref:type IV toxin-antitoxin system AbiEi family antitoxin domain-containing protein n=1 Tax=Aquidulcibacter sp. TaxID=2052990 RepID=UPI0028AB4636|nr:hypothetical protein [Aquidulcibacter sp.]
MATLATKIIEAGYGNRPFTERQLERILLVSDASRYGLVNRALRDGSLLRVRRGLYILGASWSKRGLENPEIHPFALAQALKHGSYISFETALSYHGWIPEAVYLTASVTPDSKTLRYETSNWGNFEFSPLATNEFQFLVGVSRIKVGQSATLVARPLRALMDLVASRKIAWQGLDWITHGLRVDAEHLHSLSATDFDDLEPVYKHKSAQDFLANLRFVLLPLESPRLPVAERHTRTSA